MRVIGIDPGYAFVGWAVIEKTGRGWRAVEFGVIKTSAHRHKAARLAEIAADLAQLLETHEPDAAACEWMVPTTQGATEAVLGLGVVLAVLGAAGINVGTYPPQSWKKSVAGSGNAQKDDVRAAVRDHFGLPYLPSPSHAADALGLALHHACRVA